MTSLIIVASIALMAVLIIATTSYRLFKLNQQQSTEVTRLQSQLSALCAAAVGTDNRIVKFEQALNQLKEHQNTFDLGQPEKQSYDHAIRLARKGAGIEQLIDNCNLTDEEAHLITRLHGSEDSGSQGLH